MREIPESVVAGCVALLRPYVRRLSASQFRQLISGEKPRELKTIPEIARSNGINRNTLYHFARREGVQPSGHVRGRAVFNEHALMSMYFEAR